MGPRIVVAGGGHGVASVLRALRDDASELTVIVTVADSGSSPGQARWGRWAVEDMRRVLVTLVGEDTVEGRTFARRLTINGLGEHPLGNLVLLSLSTAFGGLEVATAWLCRHLKIPARVLPATVEPVTLLGQTDREVLRGAPAIRAGHGRIDRVAYDPPAPKVPASALEAIARADWVLLAPGSLFTSVLAVSALPAISDALAGTRAEVLWIGNLRPEPSETAGMTAADQVAALRRHRVRVDTVLHDPCAGLPFSPGLLGTGSPRDRAQRLEASQPGVHDPALLRNALRELFAEDRALRGSRPIEHGTPWRAHPMI
jgi:uncharacterized cofD-like protein